MDKWKYKFSFVSGILFIMTFFIKELVVNSPEKVSIYIFMFPFLFMILYSLGLFIGYYKYSILNNKKILKISTLSTMFFYSTMIILEFIDRVTHFSSNRSILIIVSKNMLGISLIVFAISLFLLKKIYGKLTIIQSISSLLLGVTFLVPFLFLFQLPLFLIYFISITYLVNKKVKDTSYKGRLL